MGPQLTAGLRLLFLATVVSLFLLQLGCGSSPTVPGVENETVTAKVQADYTIIAGVGGSPVTNGKVTFEGNGLVKQVNLGELAELGQIMNGQSANFKITITGDNALTAIFNDVALQGMTILKTDVLSTTSFDVFIFRSSFLLGNVNQRWDYKGVYQLSFNPDFRGTGARLPIDYITAVEDTVNQVALLSNGRITAVTSDRNGDYTALQGGDGECRVFYESVPVFGIMNFAYLQGDTRAVISSALICNPANAEPAQVPDEVIDSFWFGDQSPLPRGPDDMVWKFIEFSFKRPAGEDQNYRIYADHEERTGWPTTTTSSITNLPGDITTTTLPHSLPPGVRNSPNSPPRTGTSRSPTKDRIRD